MANVIINDTNLTNIANAIREKNGGTTKYKPSEMASAILAIEGSNVPSEIPDAAFNGGYPSNAFRFYGNNWNWFFSAYGSLMKPQQLDYMMFYGNSLVETIPFNIAITERPFPKAFWNCGQLKEIPEPVELETLNNYAAIIDKYDMDEVFRQCIRLRTIPERIFGLTPEEGLDEYYRPYACMYQTGARNGIFYNCHSLRQLPRLSTAINKETDPSKSLYSQMAYGCRCLDEIVNLPVADVEFSANAFIHTAGLCHRIKNFTFELGKTANWSNQHIDLTNYVGWYSNASSFTEYNSGCVGAIRDNTSYLNYKDNPNSFATDINYSRYNKVSAIATINSLPNCSTGTGNTISFKGQSGKNTDGGAINTMTEEQIAVAVSKGWTVSLK
jgi:hypothetical protein